MVGKKYTDLTTGNVIEVKDIFEDIVILNNNSKIKANRLLDKNYFEEFIDPVNFFQNESLLNSFAQKIRQIPDEVVSNIPNDSTNQSFNPNNISGSTSIKPLFNESAVIQSDPELEKEELMRKYNITPNPNQAAQNQLEKFQQLLGEESTGPVQRVEVNRDDNGEPIQRVEVNKDEIQTENRVNNVQQVETRREIIEPKVEDPILVMFKNCKRNKDFKISLDIDNKIPRPDFIEMMEDSYNTSIIEFLAEEFTNNLLQNPNIIKEKIIKEIKTIVYGEEKIEDISPEPLKDVNPQITDAVTQTQPVRKSRPNTAKGEKGFKKETSK
jgi:hypothetical protein